MTTYGLDELLRSRACAVALKRAQPRLANYHRRRHAALAAAFGVGTRVHRDEQPLEELLDATAGVLAGLAVPFTAMADRPASVMNLYRRFGRTLGEQVEDARETLQALAVETAATLWDIPVDAVVTVDDLLRQGFDPAEPEPA